MEEKGQSLRAKIMAALNERLQARDGENDFDPLPTFNLVSRLANCVEALDDLRDYAANIQENHPDECAHGAGYSLLGQLAQQVNTDGYHTLTALRALVGDK